MLTLSHVFVGVVLALCLTLFVTQRYEVKEKAAVFMFCGLLCSSLVMTVNCMMDFSHPRQVETTIIDKNIGSSYMLSRIPSLTVEHWGTPEGQRGFQVPLSVYDEAQIGDSLGLQLGSGLLGTTWIVSVQLAESKTVDLFPSVPLSRLTFGLFL